MSTITKRVLTATECVFLYNALWTAAEQYKKDATSSAVIKHSPALAAQFKAQAEQAEALAETFVACPMVIIESED